MLFCTLLLWASSSLGAAARPDILLIVADDLGYADTSVFGSDIRTPNIQALANRGLTFTQFHTASSCAPTRSMLMTGNNNHVAGVGRQGVRNGRVTEGLNGYEGHLSDRVGILPVLLQGSGYRTYMAGKWHLGYEKEYAPSHYGFEKSFNLAGGAGNHFDETGITKAGSDYYEHGQRVDYPVGRYTTDVYTNKLIQYLDEHGNDPRPFFMFAAFTSPHWPLQVPDEDLSLYAGQFDMGYDLYREQRFDALKQTGVIPSEQVLPPRNPEVPRWDDLNATEKKRECRKMELYAAMVENLDRHIGRLIGHLKTLGKYENTLIIFMSDNGAAGSDFYQRGLFSEFLQANYNIKFGNMGKRGSFISTGPGWAEASTAPFRLYKTYASEGGITAQMIVAGPSVAHTAPLSDSYVTVSDIAPTLLEIAHASYPQDKTPMTGRSMTPIFGDASVEIHAADEVTIFFHSNKAYLRVGDWKLMNVATPFDESSFGLYNLRDDPGETTDLSTAQPEKRKELISLWRAERRAVGIVLPQDL